MASSPYSFFFTSPADRWYDALPLGNGAIGVMVYGDVREERIFLSEGTFWSGEPDPEGNCPEGAAVVAEARRELVAGGPEGLRRAERLCRKLQGHKLNYGTNLPFGNLRISSPMSFGEVTDYSRRLDLDRAVASVEYRHAGTTFRREMFVSHADQVCVVRIAADAPSRLTIRVSMDGHEQPHSVRSRDPSRIAMTVLARELVHSDGKTGVTGEGLVLIRTDGEARLLPQGDHVLVSGADAVELIMAVATSFNETDPAAVCAKRVAAAADATYEQLLANHVTDHQSLFHRAHLSFGRDKPESRPEAPIDELVRRAAAGDGDPRLFELLFQFGRYLLISSSRPDSGLPAHLLGVWNDNVACRIGWTCDYHLDINTQMNYWISELTNVPECGEPLFRWIRDRLVPSGRTTARRLYGSPGWVAHVVTNAWGYSAPGWSTYWGFHITGGVWVALHLWDRYRFSGDRSFLSDHAYPVLREAAEFFADHLFEHPETGYLVTGPTYSPENAYRVGDQSFALTVGPTVDSVLLRELFTACIQAQEALGVPDDANRRFSALIEKLPPLRVGKAGQLMEWLQDYDEALPHHRHTSHLLSLFPFSQITPDQTPELATAAAVSIDRRLNAPSGFEEGAWARNNITAFHARLGDGAAAYRSLLTLFESAGDRSLMVGTRISPKNAYEMDYNTGATAAIAEMLVQSRGDCILILPALPPAWPDGRASGLCARGGFVIDLEWRDSRPRMVTIRSRAGGPCRVRLPGAADDILIDTVAGREYEVVRSSHAR